jgi:uncharacterized membrane protein (DUF373 family)
MSKDPNSAPPARYGTAGNPMWYDRLTRLLVNAERAIFAFVGLMFFFAAFALAVRAIPELFPLVMGPQDEVMVAGTTFLDVMLLVLMIVELAYTVILSLRGSVLLAEPFLLVGLIAVIRRILVITIGEVNPNKPPAVNPSAAWLSQPVELGILTAVVLALVWSIVLLRRRPRERDPAEVGFPDPLAPH